MQQAGTTRSRTIVYAAIAILAWLAFASAQDVTEPSLKAAYIYNFAKFTEWPEGSPSNPFVICVLGDAAVGDSLERAVKGRRLAGNGISVVRPMPTGTQRVCQVLYVSGITGTQVSQLVGGLKEAPVLTISDMDGFMDMGGIVQFFFEHGQLKFSVAQEAAKRARLQISAKVLSLAIRK